MRRDSHCVETCVTLDLCGFQFQSELFRRARLQVNYVSKSSELELSNEIVKYEPRGAGFALRELKRAVATCPPHPVKSAVAGVPPLAFESIGSVWTGWYEERSHSGCRSPVRLRADPSTSTRW